MYEKYIQKGTKRLRCGYTTGTCAAGAAKAAAQTLLSGVPTQHVSIMVPAGDEIPLEVEELTVSGNSVICAVRKDGGDDPDATHGMLIYASVSKTPVADAPSAEKIETAAGRVLIDGGAGIGRVTKPGLDQPVGAAAINSVPRRMIAENVREVMDRFRYEGTLQIEISAPEGEQIAARTFNPHLGIEGGISIIGTTGIVEPMSNDAILGTVKAELSMRRAQGEKIAFLTLGNYGSSYLTAYYPALVEKAVTCSNFIGDSIDLCLEMDFEGILILGHFGKLVKLGAGIMNTHSAFADGRMEVLIACALAAGADTGTLRRIASAATTDAAIAILKECDILDAAMTKLTERVDYYLRKKVKDDIPVGAILFTEAEKVTVQTPAAGELLEYLLEVHSSEC